MQFDNKKESSHVRRLMEAVQKVIITLCKPKLFRFDGFY